MTRVATPHSVRKALAFASGCVLLVAATTGFPHAWASNWIILALIVTITASASAREFVPPGALASHRWVLAAMAALALVALLRLVVSLLHGTPASWGALGHYVAPLVVVWLAVRLEPWLRPRAALALTTGAILIAVAHGMGQMLGGLPDWRLFEPFRLHVGNSAIWIGIAVAIVASSTLLLALSHGWHQRYASAAKWAAIGGGLAVSLGLFRQSRSGLLIFAVVLVVGSVLVGRRWWQRLAAPAVLCTLVMAGFAASPVARERSTEAAREVVNALALYQVQSSQGQRLALASVSLRVWQDAFWFGHGLGTWREQFGKRVPPQWQGAIGFHTSPHNEYLHVLGQMGVVGFIAYVFVMLSLVWAGARRLLLHGTPWLFALAVAWGLGSVTNVFLWDFRFFSPYAGMLICGLACEH